MTLQADATQPACSQTLLTRADGEARKETDKQTLTCDCSLMAYTDKGWFCMSSLLHQFSTPAAYAEHPDSLVYIETYSRSLPFALVALFCGSILVSMGSQERKCHHVS